MSGKPLPTEEELSRSLSQLAGGARASGRIEGVEGHAAVVELAARDGLKALRLLPDLKQALGQKASKASREKALKSIAELTGEPHQEEPEAKEE